MAQRKCRKRTRSGCVNVCVCVVSASRGGSASVFAVDGASSHNVAWLGEVRFGRILCSPFLRCRETGAALSRLCSSGAVELEPRTRR